MAAGAVAKADRAVVTRLRRIPITTLCAAELDLEAVGVRPPAVPPEGDGS